MSVTIPEKFQAYFFSVYKDRWEGLLQSLLQSDKKMKVSVGPKDSFIDSVVFSWGSLACSLELKEDCYQLDLASVVAVAATGWETPGAVLDLCSAPGGKALALQLSWAGRGEFFLNELSQGRLLRLKSVMRQFSPLSQESLHFFKRDASRWGLSEKDKYDYVICDVPCSGEAHMLESASELARWSLKGSQRLAIRQHAILCAALDAVKPGGEILYSTCTINPVENDDVVAKFLKKRSGRVELSKAQIPSAFSQIEATAFGYQIFPDLTGTGPIYFSLLKKTQ